MGDRSGPAQLADVDLTPLQISSDYNNDILIVHNKMPWNEIILALGLLTMGVLGIVLGILLIATQTGADQARGFVYFILGALLFLPGFYESRIAYYAYKGYQGFSFANIPAV
jgi:hypothetical protein